jgi:anterior pharynx defective protein 1
MAATAFFGHFFLGIGPGIAFFLAIIAPKSFVVLLSFFSAFYWLLVLLVTSALFRGFVPLPSTQPSYAGALLAAVAIEEAARAGVWQMHKRALSVLQGMSASSGHSFNKLDELYLALGWGYGHAAVHVLFMFASLLPLTAGHGTAYSTDCPQMSIFTVAALNSLGLGASLVALSVVAMEAWGRRSLLGAAYAPLVHAGAALLVSERIWFDRWQWFGIACLNGGTRCAVPQLCYVNVHIDS